MDCFYKLNGFKRLVLFSILFTFSLAVVTPPPVYGQINIGLNDVGFGIKAQKLIDKIWRYYNKLDSRTKKTQEDTKRQFSKQLLILN